MAGVISKVKIKVATENRIMEREDFTDWVDRADRYPAAYALIGDIIFECIKRICERNPHHGISPYDPIKTLEYITWSIYNGQTGTYYKGGRYDELNEGDPPVSFMTPLPKKIDDILAVYHKLRKESGLD